MKVKFRVTVTNDDGTVARWADSELQLATAIAGLDPASAKQDFLTQAESLMRTIAENQLPALYQAVLEAPETDLEASEAKEKLQAKLKSLRERKAGAPAAEDTGDEASEEEEKGKQNEQ